MGDDDISYSEYFVHFSEFTQILYGPLTRILCLVQIFLTSMTQLTHAAVDLRELQFIILSPQLEMLHSYNGNA